MRWGGDSLLAEREIFERQAEIGKNLFHRNALAAALGEPNLSLANTATVLVGDRFIVDGCGGGSVQHGFQQTSDSRKLRRRQALNQFVDVLACLTHGAFLEDTGLPQLWHKLFEFVLT